jgi:putative DNA primase/helicase
LRGCHSEKPVSCREEDWLGAAGPHPRLADFAKWVTAAEPGLGWENGTFLKTYTGNIQDVAETAFEANPVAGAIHAMLCEPECRDYGWKGTATELLDALNRRASDTQQRAFSWPKMPQHLGNQLERVAPLLRSKGFHFERKHSGNRQIILTPLSR